jgi:uncharacterized cupredoxin-like copper-binding protein
MSSRWQTFFSGKRSALAWVAGAAAVPVAGVLIATAQPAAPTGGSVASSSVLEEVRADTTVVVRTTGSNLSFSPTQLTLKEGMTVRVRYENAGSLPHNIVLLRNRSQIDAIGIAALDAAATEYVPTGYEDEILAASPLAAPGETVEFTFTVPPGGDYPFICTYPGHFRAMQGVIRAQ